MTESFEVEWWKEYKKFLEGKFSQDEIVIRAFEIQTI